MVITFHYLDGIEYLSDRILLLEKGELIEDRPIEDFLSMRRNAVVERTCVDFCSSRPSEEEGIASDFRS